MASWVPQETGKNMETSTKKNMRNWNGHQILFDAQSIASDRYFYQKDLVLKYPMLLALLVSG